MKEHGFDEEYAERVKQCIQTHRFRKSNPPKSIEAKILFDADKLDVSGAIGIARTLIYKGTVVEPLYSLTAEGLVSNGEGDVSPSFFQEYKYKLENLYSNFYTAEGARLARERQEAAVSFYNNILREVQESYEGKEELKMLLG